MDGRRIRYVFKFFNGSMEVIEVKQTNSRHCYVQTDLSTAPSQTRFGKTDRMCYIREFEVILLVGLTELEAQIG